MRKMTRWAALLLALLMLTGCAQNAEREAPELLDPVGVEQTTATAYIGDIANTVVRHASVKPYVEKLSFKVSGQIIAIHGYPGMAVKEGDALIELDEGSLQDRADQVTDTIGYTQKDGAYSDEIAALDIEILEAELKLLEHKESELNKKKTELVTKKTELEAKVSALEEKEADLIQSAAEPEESETSSEAETSAEESEVTSEESETSSEESESTSEESEASSEESETDSEKEETSSEESEAEPEESKPEESAPVPNENELALVRAELALAKTELAGIDTELTQVEADIPATEKDIALKKNEITQMEAHRRQSREARTLELADKQKELNELKASLEENILRAPFSGQIVYGDLLAPGSWVQAEDPILFLSDDSKLSIVCDYQIPEGDLNKAERIYARIGTKEYDLKHVPIDPDELLMLTLAGMEPTTTFEFVDAEKALGEIEVGQYASVCLVDNYVPDALLVPFNAIMYDSVGEYNYVYVDENGSRVKRKVETGEASLTDIQIVEGLKEGDVVYVKE